MKSGNRFSIALGTSVLTLGLCTSAGAVDLGALKGLAGGADMASVSSGSIGNAAGVIEFCVKNNFLGGDTASSVKQGLMSKLGGGEEAEQTNSDYSSGTEGLLQTGDGSSIDLAKFGDMKQSLTKKACSSVLEHAKSFL